MKECTKKGKKTNLSTTEDKDEKRHFVYSVFYDRSILFKFIRVFYTSFLHFFNAVVLNSDLVEFVLFTRPLSQFFKGDRKIHRF